MKALHDVVFVKVESSESKTGSGIITASQENPTTGEVVKCGPGTYLESGDFVAVDLQPGDKVVFNPAHNGHEMTIEGEKLLALSYSEIFGTL